MHHRSLHKQGYNFALLIKSSPELTRYVLRNPVGRQTIDFSQADGVKALNAALLKHYYGIHFWDIPKGFLCPPIPGRADYIHGIADLIFDQKNASTSAEKPVFDGVTGLDIGTGANLIYPILGSQIYDWKFVATDIDKVAIKSAGIIQQANKALTNKIHLRHQQNPAAIFTGVIKQQDQFMFSMCNPPFHLSEQAAASGSQRKIQNLHKHQKKHNSIPATLKNNRTQNDKHILNFSGQHNELWCEGGEVGFISRMITQSTEYKHQVKWFTSLVSKKDSLIPISKALSAINPLEVKVVEMGQGNKLSRFVAWRFC